MKKYIIGVIGLGYVGLPLAVEFARKYKVIGYDINSKRVAELKDGIDSTREVNLESLNEVLESCEQNTNKGLLFTHKRDDLRICNVYIVTVPTPIDKYNKPDLNPLVAASELIGSIISKNDIVVYESTTYPGCTEEECMPIIERVSGMKYNEDFFAGYSPERINPGDKVNTFTKIKKVTSGSTIEVAKEVDNLYSSIITAGTYLASSIKVAEASKVVENAQRDINISFVNELALIFDKIGIDTADVLDAAATKWNFLKYQPGLVGGHCIGVDPYYLATKAESVGYQPQVILSGRYVNNSIAPFIAHKVIKLMIKKGHQIKNSNILILGFTFKENCPDIRNTKVIDIYQELLEFDVNIDVCDPWASSEDVHAEYGIDIVKKVNEGKKYSAIILAVSHMQFLNFDYQKHHLNNTVIFDTKAIINKDYVDARL